MRKSMIAAMLSIGVVLTSCERKLDSSTPATPAGGSSGAAKKDDRAQKPDEKKEAGAKPAETDGQKQGPHGGAGIDLGSTTVDGMIIKASRDAGELKPGGDAPIDVWIDGGLGNAAAVRFWIGTEDAKGALKAKAEVEDGKWHTHTEVPDPLPVGSKLWVEVEGKDGKQTTASFDLKK